MRKAISRPWLGGLGLLVAAGCARPTEKAPDAAPQAESGAREPQAPAALQPPVADPRAAWNEASRNLRVGGAAPPAAGLRYGLREGCELRYSVREQLDLHSNLFAEDRDRGLYMIAELLLRRDGEHFPLSAEAFRLGHREGGLRRPAGDNTGPHTTARLATDGSSWSEVGDRSQVWADLGSFSGLALFFPALPASAAPGSDAPWPLVWGGRSSKSTADAGAPTVFEEHARARIEEWIQVEGQLAAVVTAAWSSTPAFSMALPEMQGRSIGGMSTRADSTVHGRYVILSSGRLLHGWVGRSMNTTTETKFDSDAGFSPDQNHTQQQRHLLFAQIRLVQACDGAVLPRFVDTTTPKELALQAITELRNAAVTGDDARVAAAFAAPVVVRHGKQKLASVMKTHLERYGPTAIGTPELGGTTTEEGDGTLVLELSGSAKTFGGGQSRFGMTTRIRGRLQQGAFLIESIVAAVPESLASRAGRPPITLEIDARKITTSAPRDPSP